VSGKRRRVGSGLFGAPVKAAGAMPDRDRSKKKAAPSRVARSSPANALDKYRRRGCLTAVTTSANQA
jgi:hypothetical protein